MRVRPGVRADLDSRAREPAQRRPVHRQELVGISPAFLGELRDRKRGAARGCKLGADEDRRRHLEAPECREDALDASVRVVEGHVEKARVDGRHGFVRRRSAKAAPHERLDLANDLVRRDRQARHPLGGCAVVAEDEWPPGRRHCTSKGSNTSQTSARNDSPRHPCSSTKSRRYRR